MSSKQEPDLDSILGSGIQFTIRWLRMHGLFIFYSKASSHSVLEPIFDRNKTMLSKNEEFILFDPFICKKIQWLIVFLIGKAWIQFLKSKNKLKTDSKWTSSEEFCAEFKVFMSLKNWLQCSSVKPAEAWFLAKISFVSSMQKILHTLKFPLESCRIRI